jgi:hypothetical protein
VGVAVGHLRTRSSSAWTWIVAAGRPFNRDGDESPS